MKLFLATFSSKQPNNRASGKAQLRPQCAHLHVTMVCAVQIYGFKYRRGFNLLREDM